MFAATFHPNYFNFRVIFNLIKLLGFCNMLLVDFAMTRKLLNYDENNTKKPKFTIRKYSLNNIVKEYNSNLIRPREPGGYIRKKLQKQREVSTLTYHLSEQEHTQKRSNKGIKSKRKQANPTLDFCLLPLSLHFAGPLRAVPKDTSLSHLIGLGQ